MKVLHTEASIGWGGQEIRILRESLGMIKRIHTQQEILHPQLTNTKRFKGNLILSDVNVVFCFSLELRITDNRKPKEINHKEKKSRILPIHNTEYGYNF